MSRRVTISSILMAALAVRLFRLGDPLGGFHGFNEAWYSVVAQNYAGGSLLVPVTYTGAPDFNIPPMFSWLVYLCTSVFGGGEFFVRLPSVAASLVFVYMMFRVVETLYGERAGIAAALMAAAMPVSVMLGRNAQVDMTAAALITAFYYSSLKSNGKPAGDVLSGLLLGAAILTKQPSALALVPVVLYRPGSDSIPEYIKRRLPWILAAALALAAPFYLYHIISGSGELFAAKQKGLVNYFNVPGAEGQLFLLREAVSAMSPPLFAAGWIGLGAALMRRGGRAWILPASTTAVYTIFYFFFHHHTYYMFYMTLGLIPAAAGLFGGERRAPVKTWLLIGVCAWALLSSVIMLTVVKYGWQTFAELGGNLDSRGISAPVVIAPGQIVMNYGPLISYYAPGAEVVAFEGLGVDADGIADIDYEGGFALLAYNYAPFPVRGGEEFTAGNYIEGIYLFGYRIYGVFPGGNSNPHCFSTFRLDARRLAPPYVFGVRREAYIPVIRVNYFDPSHRLIIKNKGIEITAVNGIR